MNLYSSNRYVILLLFSCITVLYLFIGRQYILAQSITSDEASFYNYAVRFLKGNPERATPKTDNSKMPISVLNTLPRMVEQIVSPNLHKNDMGIADIIYGRYITLLFSLLTVGLVFVWAKQLFDLRSGLFAAFLFACCPNNIAAATLVTTDSYSVFFFLLVMYFTWLYCTRKKNHIFYALALTVAFSQLVKQSLFHLYILVPLCIFIYQVLIEHKYMDFWTRGFWKRIGLFLLINVLIINFGYYFYQSGRELGSFVFMSDLFSSLQRFLPQWLPVPFPKPFIDGLDMAKFYDQVGGGVDGVSSFGKVTILDRSFTGRGVWYYYFVTILFKTPLAYFLFFFTSLCVFMKVKIQKEKVCLSIFLLLPVVYFLIVMSFFYQTQCGIRHVVFIYPLLFIFSAQTLGSTVTLLKKGLLLVGVIYLPITMLSYYNNYYSYSNELIIRKHNAYKYIGAANLDFMHTRIYFQKFLATHPEVKKPNSTPAPGLYLISVEDYLDIWNRNTFDWLQDCKPIGHVAHAGLLIRVNKLDLRNKRD